MSMCVIMKPGIIIIIALSIRTMVSRHTLFCDPSCAIIIHVDLSNFILKEKAHDIHCLKKIFTMPIKKQLNSL